MPDETAIESLELGSIELDPTCTDLQLQLSSTLRFAPSTKDVSQEKLTSQTLTPLSSARPWIQNAGAFEFVISLRQSNCLQDRASAGLIRTLASALQSAEVWKRLNLAPTGVQTSKDEETEADLLTISLEYDSKESTDRKRCLHKLSTDVASHEVQVLPGIATWSLKAVRLTIHVTHSQKRKRRKLDRRVDSGSDNPLPVAGEDLHFRDHNQWSDEGFSNGKGERGFWPGSSIHSDADFDNFSLELHAREASGSMDDPTPHTMRGDCPTGLDIPSVPARKRPPRIVQDDTTEQTKCYSQSAVLSLIASAVQIAITGCSSRLLQGIKVRNAGSLTSLSEAAPATWSPGYIVAVSNRAVFLPTIHKALATIVDKSRSAILRSMINKSQGHGSRWTRIDTTAHDGLAALLWHTLQNGVYDESRWRRLHAVWDLMPGAMEGVCDPLESFGSGIDDGNHVFDIADDDMLDDDSHLSDGDVLTLESDRYSDDGREYILDDEAEQFCLHSRPLLLTDPVHGNADMLNATVHDTISRTDISIAHNDNMEEDDLLYSCQRVKSLGFSGVLQTDIEMMEKERDLHPRRLDGHFGSDLFADSEDCDIVDMNLKNI